MTQNELIKRFGDPRGTSGKASSAWEMESLSHMLLPYQMRASWGGAVNVAVVHDDVKLPLRSALKGVWNAARLEVKRKYGGEDTAFYDKKTKAYLRWLGLDVFGGTYCFRPIKGGHTLSTHAFGAAIDIDPLHNAMGTKGRMPPWVVEIFEKQGFVWGGNWKRPDPMHFEYTKL